MNELIKAGRKAIETGKPQTINVGGKIIEIGYPDGLDVSKSKKRKF